MEQRKFEDVMLLIRMFFTVARKRVRKLEVTTKGGRVMDEVQEWMQKDFVGLMSYFKNDFDFEQKYNREGVKKIVFFVDDLKIYYHDSLPNVKKVKLNYFYLSGGDQWPIELLEKYKLSQVEIELLFLIFRGLK